MTNPTNQTTAPPDDPKSRLRRQAQRLLRLDASAFEILTRIVHAFKDEGYFPGTEKHSAMMEARELVGLFNSTASDAREMKAQKGQK